MRRPLHRPAGRPDEAASAMGWAGTGPGDAVGAGEVIEGGAPDWKWPRTPAWKRPRMPRPRWPVGVVLGIALAAGGAALVWGARSAQDVPSLASLRALPSASSGLLTWAPRGQLVGDDGFVRDALQTLRSSGPADRPRTRLHLLYAGGQVVLLEGRDRHGRVSLAQVVDGEVLVDRLRQRDPVALTLPVGAGLRFLVPPATTGAPGPAVVYVQDRSLDLAGGFRALPADATGLTEEFQPGPDARFAVLEPVVLEAPAPEAGMTSGERLRGDGVVVAGSLTPAVPAIRLTRSPWPTQGDQAPSRQWLTDAKLLGAAVPTRGPLRVAILMGGGGFTPGPPRPDGKSYSGALYAVTDVAGSDYVGYVLRLGDEPLCQRLTPVRGRFADLLVVGGRCDLPGESVAAVDVITRPDVRRGVIELSGKPGSPPQRTPITAGVAEAGLVLVADPAYRTVTLTAATDRSSTTYVVPRG